MDSRDGPNEPLTVAQKEAIVEAIKAIRLNKRNAKSECHGWKVEWVVRGKAASMRGDLHITSPGDEQVLHSIVAVQRKLGLIEPPPPTTATAASSSAEPGTDSAPTSFGSGLYDNPVDINHEGRSRRARPTINYAELTTVSPRLPELVLKVLDDLEQGRPEGAEPLGADLARITDGVHLLQDALERLRPFSSVQRTLKSMLRQGLLRRRIRQGLASGVPAPTTSDAPTAVEDTLNLLVLSTLQVEPEDLEEAPWRLEAPEVKTEATNAVATNANADRGEEPNEEEGEGTSAQQLANTAGGEVNTEAPPLVSEDGAPESAVPHEASQEAEAKDSLAPVAWSGVRVRVSGLRKRDGLGRLLDASGVPIWDGIEAPEPPDDGPWFEEDEDEEEDEEDEPEGSGRYVKRRRGARGHDDDDDPYVYMNDSDSEYEEEGRRGGRSKGKGKRRGSDGGAGSGVRGGGGGGEASGPQVERLLSVVHLKERLPINGDPMTFGCPSGWEEVVVDEGRRRAKRKYRRLDPAKSTGSADGAVEAPAAGPGDYSAAVVPPAVVECERRWDVEALLEREAEAAGRPHLGQLYNGEWQISSRALTGALSHVLHSLTVLGLVREVPAEQMGRAHSHWVAVNTYVRGVPFPRPPKPEGQGGKRAKPEEEETEEDLADIEKERLRNIERNKEILRQLGLA